MIASPVSLPLLINGEGANYSRRVGMNACLSAFSSYWNSRLTALFVLNLLKEVHFICLGPSSYYFSITLIMVNYECYKLNISIFVM